jgi:hypothetical protein
MYLEKRKKKKKCVCPNHTFSSWCFFDYHHGPLKATFEEEEKKGRSPKLEKMGHGRRLSEEGHLSGV